MTSLWTLPKCLNGPEKDKFGVKLNSMLGTILASFWILLPDLHHLSGHSSFSTESCLSLASPSVASLSATVVRLGIESFWVFVKLIFAVDLSTCGPYYWRRKQSGGMHSGGITSVDGNH